MPVVRQPVKNRPSYAGSRPTRAFSHSAWSSTANTPFARGYLSEHEQILRSHLRLSLHHRYYAGHHWDAVGAASSQPRNCAAAMKLRSSLHRRWSLKLAKILAMKSESGEITDAQRTKFTLCSKSCRWPYERKCMQLTGSATRGAQNELGANSRNYARRSRPVSGRWNCPSQGSFRQRLDRSSHQKCHQ